jgi:hypothetical protein
VTDFGIVMNDSDEHLWKHEFPIEENKEYISIQSNLEWFDPNSKLQWK